MNSSLIAKFLEIKSFTKRFFCFVSNLTLKKSDYINENSDRDEFITSLHCY